MATQVKRIVHINASRLVKNAAAKTVEQLKENGLNFAKELCPVDTGKLRNSIKMDEESFFSTEEYAPYVEYGTENQKAQPFMRPAARSIAKQAGQIIKKEMKDRTNG